ncbi:uncharacterized protein LOC143036656 [Oratosquilla oratoria]|uniref:uncharacterized protein LOC143036656 n=1 Tax=Oratosquilla oratoria TaxID=337810 RepID=UPI003F761EA8
MAPSGDERASHQVNGALSLLDDSEQLWSDVVKKKKKNKNLLVIRATDNETARDKRFEVCKALSDVQIQDSKFTQSGNIVMNFDTEDARKTASVKLNSVDNVAVKNFLRLAPKIMICNVNKIEDKDMLLDTLVERNVFLKSVDHVMDKMKVVFSKKAAGDTYHYIIRCEPEVRSVIRDNKDKLRLQWGGVYDVRDRYHAMSLRNKSLAVRDLISEECFDVFAVTETWLSDYDSTVITEMTPASHTFLHSPRMGRRGGGVGNGDVFLRAAKYKVDYFDRTHQRVHPNMMPGMMWLRSETGINPSQRIIDPRKGPIRKTVGVRSLPRLDGEALDELEASAKGWRYGMSRSRSRGRRKTRAKSLDAKKRGKSSHLESSAQTPKSEEPNTISDGFVRVTSTSKNFDKSDGFIRFHSGGSVENFVKKDDVVEGEAQPQVESNSWMEGGSKRDSGVATMEKGRPRRSEDPKTTVRMTRRPREDPPMLFRRDPRGETKKALRGETKRPSKGETTGPTRGETRRALGGRNRAGSTSKSRQGSKERKVEREGAEERDQFAQSVNEALLRSNLEFTQSRSGDEDVEGNDGGLAPNRGNEDRSFLSVGHHEESSEVRNKGSSAEDPDHGFSESQESPDSGLRDGGSGGDLEGEDTRTKGTGSDGGASDDGFADDDDARGGNEEVFGGASMTKLPETFAEETAKERSDLLLPEGKVVPPEDYHNEPRSSGDSQRSSSGVFDDFEASTTASIELNSEDMAMETLEPNKV